MSRLRALALVLPLSLLLNMPSVWAQETSTKVAVMPFSIAVGLQNESTARLLDELLLTELSKRAGAEQKFLGSSDITAVLGLEQQKAMLGCDDESCLAEIGNALGVERMVTPALGKLGDKFAINFKVIDPATVTVIRRGSFVVPADEGALPAAMSELAHRILGQVPASSEAQASARAPSATPSIAAGPAGDPEQTDEGKQAESREGGPEILSVAGMVLAGTGLAVLAGSAVAVGLADSTLGDPGSSGVDKQGALTGYAGGLAGAGAGLVVAGVGATLFVLGM